MLDWRGTGRRIEGLEAEEGEGNASLETRDGFHWFLAIADVVSVWRRQSKAGAAAFFSGRRLFFRGLSAGFVGFSWGGGHVLGRPSSSSSTPDDRNFEGGRAQARSRFEAPFADSVRIVGARHVTVSLSGVALSSGGCCGHQIRCDHPAITAPRDGKKATRILNSPRRRGSFAMGGGGWVVLGRLGCRQIKWSGDFPARREALRLQGHSATTSFTCKFEGRRLVIRQICRCPRPVGA